MQYLDLADYLLIAEVVLGVPAEEIARWPGIGLADSALHAPMAAFENVELYPDAIDKAAVLCVRLARNRSLPDGNQTRRIFGDARVPRAEPDRVDATFSRRDGCGDRERRCRHDVESDLAGWLRETLR